jgi:triosephosphate isomerase (TIM)
MEKKLLVSNWKMYLSQKEAVALARDIAATDVPSSVDLVLCPSSAALTDVAKEVKNVALGGQDAFWEEDGAHTGELSSTRLKELGCTYAILGHSERRALGETDEVVQKKIHAAITQGLVPILCVGENVDIREAGDAVSFVQEQLERALEGNDSAATLIVAYEPIWAIGTGNACSTKDAEEMKVAIDEKLSSLGRSGTSVLYGGSVTADNVSDYTIGAAYDGVLVGGASTKIDSLRALLMRLSEVYV